MRNKTLGIIGIVIFVIALMLIFSKHFVDNGFLKGLEEYGRYIAALGGAFIGVGFFGKKKSN